MSSKERPSLSGEGAPVWKEWAEPGTQVQKPPATEAARLGSWREPGSGVRMRVGVGEGTPPNSSFRIPRTLRIPLRSDGAPPLLHPESGSGA